MSTERRLDKLEQSLTPVQAVLRWLDEAHAFGSIDEYLASTFGKPAPLDQLVNSLERGIRESMRGQPREAVATAARTAGRQTAFRFLLVLRLNVAASDEAREKGLMAATLFFWMRTLATDEIVQAGVDAEAGGQHAGWERWHSAVIGLLERVYVEEDARASLEREYLDGRPSLFPDLERAWAEAREQAERVARLGEFLQHVGDDAPPDSVAEVDLTPFRSGAATAAAERAAYLADIVRAHTWQLSGDHARAIRILTDRFGRSDNPGQAPTL